MDLTKRLADPRIYKCSLEQSVESTEFILDRAPYNYCEGTNTVLQDDTEKPISSLGTDMNICVLLSNGISYRCL